MRALQLGIAAGSAVSTARAMDTSKLRLRSFSLASGGRRCCLHGSVIRLRTWNCSNGRRSCSIHTCGRRSLTENESSYLLCCHQLEKQCIAQTVRAAPSLPVKNSTFATHAHTQHRRASTKHDWIYELSQNDFAVRCRYCHGSASSTTRYSTTGTIRKLRTIKRRGVFCIVNRKVQHT